MVGVGVPLLETAMACSAAADPLAWWWQFSFSLLPARLAGVEVSGADLAAGLTRALPFRNLS
jgi:hypothetical protein